MYDDYDDDNDDSFTIFTQTTKEELLFKLSCNYRPYGNINFLSGQLR